MTSHNDVAEAFSYGRSATGSNMFTQESGGKLRLYSYGTHFILAVRLDEGSFLLNGDTYSVSTSKHQGHTRDHCNPAIIVPFSALEEAGINERDYESLQVIDQTPDQTRDVPYKDHKTGEMKTREEHLLGACLFKYGRKYLLSGVDTDAKNWGGGYFLVELKKPARSVNEAFEALKPKDLNPDDNYIRQGEFFFVPQATGTKELKKLRPQAKQVNEWRESNRFEIDEWGLRRLEEYIKHNVPSGSKIETVYQPETENDYERFWIRYQVQKDTAKGVILKGKNLAVIIGGNDSGNPHIARDTFIVSKGEVYARGSVRHPEHKMINLGETWHKVLINEAKTSFSSGGNVD